MPASRAPAKRAPAKRAPAKRVHGGAGDGNFDSKLPAAPAAPAKRGFPPRKTAGGPPGGAATPRKAPEPPRAMAARAEGLTLRLEPTRAARDATVTIGLPFEVNPWVLDAIACPTPDGPLETKGLDHAVVAFAAYQAVEDKLCDGTAEIKNAIFGKPCCGAQGGEFLISVTCDKSPSTVKRVAANALLALSFKSLYPRYADLCRRLRVAPDREAFNHAAAAANRALHAGPTIVITGRVTAKSEADLATVAAALRSKIKDSAPESAGRARAHVDAGAKASVADKFSSVPAAGLDGALAHRYVVSHLKGEAGHEVGLWGGRLWFPKNKERTVRALADATKIDRFAKAFAKLGVEARGAFVHLAAKQCALSTAAISRAGALGEREIVTAIRKSLPA